ncbi:hypothetical protein C8J56DRAFT_1051854 [Mycena floridula]|nr:hypothetical protein C8J56DRAFT_1051854 [Mycena floridula]
MSSITSSNGLMNLADKSFFRVMAHLTFDDICRLKCTNRETAARCSRYITIAFDIDAKLLPFFPDVVAAKSFRRELAKADGVIGGSFAFQFFSRSIFPSSDLDVYITLAGAQSFIEACMKTGALRSDNNEVRDGPTRGFINLFNKSGKNMQVIIVQNTPVDAILSYHSTGVMNFIAGSRAYSLYPYETFVSQHILVTGKLTNKFVPLMAISKYEQRGYQSTISFHGSTFHNQLRRIGDRETWTIDFGGMSDDQDIYEGNTWHLREASHGDQSPFTEVCKRMVTHARLLYDYTTACGRDPTKVVRKLRQRMEDNRRFRYDKEYVEAVKEATGINCIVDNQYWEKE